MNFLRTAEEIFALLFLSDPTKISLRWLKRLCVIFDNQNVEKTRKYFLGGKTRKESAGRPQQLSVGEKE